jgi:hypothetical protein
MPGDNDQAPVTRADLTASEKLLRQEIATAENRIITLLTDFKESLEREMRSGFAALHVRFDTQAARLDRHAALIQTGSRWTARMNEWAEKVDQSLEDKDRQIAELRKRIDGLEKK